MTPSPLSLFEGQLRRRDAWEDGRGTSSAERGDGRPRGDGQGSGRGLPTRRPFGRRSVRFPAFLPSSRPSSPPFYALHTLQTLIGTFSSVYKAIDLKNSDYNNSLWLNPSSESDDEGAGPSKRRKVQPKVYVAIKRIYVTSSPSRIENEISILEDLRFVSLPFFGCFLQPVPESVELRAGTDARADLFLPFLSS